MAYVTIISIFLTSLIALILLRPIAIKLDLVDYPNERKDHIGNIPLIGGTAIFLGILIHYIFVFDYDKFTSVLLITASLILFQGVWDDFANLKARSKIAFQAFLTVIVIYLTDTKLESFGYLFGDSYHLDLGLFSIPVTIIAVVGLTNAFNMIDGFDGLASSFVIIAIIGCLGFKVESEISSFANILFAVIAALVPFMIFNITSYNKTKVFLGDGGSLFLGYIISWALIYHAENVNNFNHSFALWCVAIPLFDFFTVIIVRILEKRSLVVANKDHIHHFFKSLGFSRMLVLGISVLLGFFCLLIGNLVEDKFPTLSFLVFLIFFLVYLFVRIYYNFKNKVT